MILLLDGTSDSRDLACELMASGYSIIATAITSDGVKKLEDKNIRAIQGKMDYKALVSKCRELSIDVIIDGTHPYADSMHENAIKASKEAEKTRDFPISKSAVAWTTRVIMLDLSELSSPIVSFMKLKLCL